MKFILLSFLSLTTWQLSGQSFWKLHGSETDKLARHSGILYANDLDFLLVSTYNMGIFRSTDLGNTWENVLMLPKDQPVTTLARSSKGTILGGGIGKIFRSETNGDKWEEIKVDFTVIKTIVEDKAGNLFLCSADSGGIMKSEDDGLTWKTFTNGLPNNYVNNLVVDGHGNLFCTLVNDETDVHGGLFYWSNQQNAWVKKELKVNLDNSEYVVKISSVKAMTISPAGEIVISADGVVTNFEFRALLKNTISGVIGETTWEQDKWSNTSSQSFGLLLENIFYTSTGSVFVSRLSGVSPGIYAKMAYAPRWFLCNEGIHPVNLVKSYFFEKDGIVYVTSDFTNKIYRTNEAMPGKKYAEITVQPLQPMKLYGYQNLNATSAAGEVKFKSMDNHTSINGNQLRATNTGTAVIKAYTDGNDSMYYSETIINVEIAKAENKITVEAAAEYMDGDTAINISAYSSSGESVVLKVIHGNATFNKNRLEYKSPGKVVFIATEQGNNSYEQADTVKTELCINPKKPYIITDTIDGKLSLKSSSLNDNKWFFNSNFSSSEPAIFPLMQGLYSLQVVTDGCASQFSDIFDYVISGVSNIHYKNFNIYPNPAYDKAIVENFSKMPVRFNFSDTSGKVLLNGNSEGGDIELNLIKYPSGLYFLRIFGTNFSLYFLVVKR